MTATYKSVNTDLFPSRHYVQPVRTARYGRSAALKAKHRKKKIRLFVLLTVELMVIAGLLLFMPYFRRIGAHFKSGAFRISAFTAVENTSVENTSTKNAVAQDTAANPADLPILSPSDTPWNLILVNKANPLPDGFDLEFTTLSNGQRVDQRIYPDLQAMFDAARSQDIYPYVREGFRTRSEQQAIFNDKVKSFRKQGHMKKTAQQMAAQWVALPGTSEHELGLAVDINADSAYSTNDDVYLWLANHAWEYGFILRYPRGKEEITGIDYEPWHYRYVGREAAKEITEAGITLEEYIQSFQGAS